MSKIIYDPIHKYITINPICLQIIDTPIFQRLRNLHQTGIVFQVFPGATHTRFEHSIGVSFLAGKMLRSLKKINPN